MGRSIEVIINEVAYVGVTAPAKDQVEMMQLASHNGLLPAMAANVSDMALMASMAALDGMSLNRLKVICLKNMIRQADSIPVAENLFQDEIHFYLVLLGKVLRENIGPFWQLKTSESQNDQEEAATTAG